MENKRSLDSLTGLKGIFIFVIVLFHTLPQTPLMDRIPMTAFLHNYGGIMGNYMFFLLSGFLIANGYRDRIAGGQITFRDYLLRRLRKLYPLYLLSNSVMLAQELVQHGISAINLKKIALTLLLQCGGGLETAHPYNGPAWFVSALFVCYIAYFFAARYAGNRTRYGCLLAAGILWGYSIAVGGWTPPVSFARNGESFLNFFLGCALAEVLPALRERTGKGTRIGAAAALAVSFVLMMAFGVEVIAGDFRAACAFVICPLILYLAAEAEPVARFLRSKPMLWLGGISVSVYFWHYVLYDFYEYVYWTRFAGPVGDLGFAVYMLLLFVCCILSHSFLEKGKRWNAFWDRVFR